TNPEMMRPPDMTSSIATAPASRTGFAWSAGRLPKIPILIFFVRWVSTAATRLGEGMSPLGLGVVLVDADRVVAALFVQLHLSEVLVVDRPAEGRIVEPV